MIKETYITFEQAKDLKKLGFPQKSSISPNVYADGEYRESFYPEDATWYREVIVAPTLSLIQKWLREEKKIHIEVHYDISTNDYSYTMDRITKISSISAEYKDRHKTYEEALSVGIDKAINILKNSL